MSTLIKLGIIFFLTSYCHNVSPQSEVVSNNKTIYLEFGGNGVELASLNYDRRFSGKNYGLGGKIGLSVTNEYSIIVPAVINYVIGKSKHKLELGIGIMYAFEHYHGGEIDLFYDGLGYTGNINYRLDTNSGFQLRVGIAPWYNDAENFMEFTFLWPSLSFGYSF